MLELVREQRFELRPRLTALVDPIERRIRGRIARIELEDTAVRVTVPGSYAAPGQWVIEFSGPVAAALPRTGTVPVGCA